MTWLKWCKQFLGQIENDVYRAFIGSFLGGHCILFLLLTCHAALMCTGCRTSLWWSVFLAHKAAYAFKLWRPWVKQAGRVVSWDLFPHKWIWIYVVSHQALVLGFGQGRQSTWYCQMGLTWELLCPYYSCFIISWRLVDEQLPLQDLQLWNSTLIMMVLGRCWRLG